MRLIVFLFVLSCFGTTFAADWVMIQSTERAESDEAMHPWFFFQPTYTYMEGSSLKAGPFAGQDAIFNLNGPEFRNAHSYTLFRGFIAARGKIPGTEGKINYFGILDIGKNGLTLSDKVSKHPTNLQMADLSMTFSYIPFARIRIGQFLTPSSDEMMEAPHTWDFVYFSEFANQIMLEPFLESDGGNTADANLQVSTTGGFRDIGAMVFDSFKTGSFQHTYAVMMGNGNGISRWDNDSHKDIYWKWRTEFTGAAEGGAKPNYVALYHWGIDGSREIYVTSASAFQRKDRQRLGWGGEARFGSWRAEFEYGRASGMIPDGTDGGALPGSTSNNGLATASLNMLPDEKANGYLVALAYDFMPSYTLAARFDRLNRGTMNAANTRVFKTTTLSAQYRFDEKRLNRLMFNYEFRDGEAPQNAVADSILSGLDDRISLSLLLFF